MKTVMICPNMDKPNILEAVLRTYDVIHKFGARCILASDASSLMLNRPDIALLSQEEGIKASDFVVVLGGDGTILSTSKYAAKHNVPIIGVNMGHVGFMTELEFSEIDQIEKIFLDEYSIDSRMMLDIEVIRQDKIVFETVALNEVIITNGNQFRIINLIITADGVPVSSFRGDGVIIGTPTGSTAYSLAAGGPVIEPTAENISVTPVCAHALQAKSYVFAPEREICVSAKSLSGRPIYISADGEDGFELMPFDTVAVRKSSLTTRLIRVKGKSFYLVLKQKLSDGSVGV